MRTLLAALLLLWVQPAIAYPATVNRVLDGDTLEVEHNGEMEKLRLYGIDAPEKKQPYGKEALEHLVRNYNGKLIEVEKINTDKYGRVVAKIYRVFSGLNGADKSYINLELVLDGYAWWYSDYAKRDDDLRIAHYHAANSKHGLWSGDNPIPPWDWRKGQRPAKTYHRSFIRGTKNLTIYCGQMGAAAGRKIFMLPYYTIHGAADGIETWLYWE